MSEKIDMVSQPKESFWKLSIPIMAFCIFDSIYGIVDMAWVSQISVEASFAMGVSIPLVTLIFAFGDSIGQGTNSIMSRFMGADDYESAYNALIHGIIFANIIWVLIIILLVFTPGKLFDMDSNHTYLLVLDYLIPIISFVYVFIFVNVFAETLQAEGNSRIPAVLMISSNILNIILDPIFIFNFNMGIKGAAYATVLTSAIPFVFFLFLYLSGRTKVPLSLKYFKFRPYILYEIFKVTLPNFLDNGLWAFTATFINGILLVTLGEIGPVLYSTSNKIRGLLVSPIKGYGRALMSVTGHLFGAQSFDELSEMFKYTLKISLITSGLLVTAFMILRNPSFNFFSIIGYDSQIFNIGIFGIIIMLSAPISMMASKMLDGFGKSMYSLVFNCAKIGCTMIFIQILYMVLNKGISVLIGITLAELVFAIAYYLFLRYLLKNFDKKYKNKDTVKKFSSTA